MKDSLQYRRTDKAIMNAFIHLVTEMPFEKITVQDILEEALVSRYTFYVHFHDKYEIAERLQEEVYQEFKSFMRKQIPELDAKAVPEQEHHELLDLEAARFVRKHQVKTQALKNIRTETVNFDRVMKHYFADNYKEHNEKREDVELEAAIYANMIAAVMEHYTDYRASISSSYSHTVMNAHIRACLYGIGIHDEKTAGMASDYLSDLVYGRYET